MVHFVSVQARRRRLPRVPFDLPASGRWGVRVLAHHGRFVVGVHRREMRALTQLAHLQRLAGGPITTRSWSTMLTVARQLEER